MRIQALIATRRHEWSAAAPALDEGLALARRIPYPFEEAQLLHVYGQLALARGDDAAARAHAGAARAIVQRLGVRHPYA